MKQAHERTQSDFKGQKAQNKSDYKEYLLEGVYGQRTLYLPTVSGWQSINAFDETVFVAFDESNPNALYGIVYLPKKPIMQSDGQTQTAALFAAARSKEAIEGTGVLDNLLVTLEVELKVDDRGAGQSFADRNGRGSKKNKNLVISLDTSSALSELRLEATRGTVFENRLATGRNTSTSETATTYVVDLSTMEQMLLNVVFEGKRKPEHFKHIYVLHFKPFARDFVEMLEDCFADQWLEKTPTGEEPFRRKYVHAWPFALKAIALAYHRARYDELGPLAAATLHKHDASKTAEEAFVTAVAAERMTVNYKATISWAELRSRLKAVDWLRYREHWIKLTGAKVGKDGKARTRTLKNGLEVVVGQAQNTATVIHAVQAKILSDRWTDLTEQIDAIPSAK